MTYPTKPSASYDYTAYQASNPSDPLPADELEADLAEHKTSIDAIIDFQKLVQRSDGNLKNGSVRPESLSSDVLVLMGDVSFEGDWVTATAYAVNDVVNESGTTYVCLEAHTSGTFATDLAAGKWQMIGTDAPSLTGDNAFSGDNDFTGGTIVADTQAAGDDTTSVATTAFVQAAVGKVIIQKFTASGTYTPTTGMVKCIIECWGGGGGGAGIGTSASSSSASGGGGAGGYSRKLATAADIGASKTVTIGAAGAAGAAGDNVGGNGGDTSVGTLCIAKGGSGAAAMGSNVSGLGGAGGVAGTGDVTGTGEPGGCGVGQAGAVTVVPVSGRGGSTAVGGGGRSAIQNTATSVAAGNAGTGFGAGGSGAVNKSAGGATTAAGGAGTAGLVIITEFCNQ